ncbi:efflux RND transporter periplasmic adaptor subunit [Parvularcula lutaonensis]|uniref:Efflux RND transporter periplasmic adaptor subunit n=1 Tax=Parvularcula lutaonensis TaxID=491923 RepID=A0ABV7MDE1_9PROT|nr:efflux RND transporter periplasmic adaptor subunit [Parvularcula lutaonensis]GGY48912.1 RND transporter MFP subunit [Parvularcula lutaonensis]
MRRSIRSTGRGALWLATAATIGVGALLGGRAVVTANAEDGVAAEPLPVAVFEARYQDSFEERRLFSGRIAPAQVADAGFQLPGEVAEVLVRIGDRVERGAPLAKLDPVRIELRRREVEAQLSEARAILERAEATLARVVTLVEEGFATAQELDDVTAERNSAAERVRLRERSLARAVEDADDTVLKAPFSGFVVRRYVDAGETVAAGQPVVRLNEAAALEATVGVPTELADQLVVGERYPLVSGDLEAEGIVEGISDDVDLATRSRAVRLRITNDSGLVPGNLIRLALSSERRGRGAWVPIAALQEGYRGLWSVYVVDSDETIRRKDVEILSLSDDRAFVTGTLDDGDRVVSSSTFRFVRGQKVRVVTVNAGEMATSAAASTVR